MLTEQLLKIFSDLMLDKEPMAPDSISNAMYERCMELGHDEAFAEKVSNAAFEFAWTLVGDDMDYL
jgi:hypothetical protein